MKHLTLSYIKENVTDDESFIGQLLDVFLQGLENDLPQLEKAIELGDHTSIQHSAHKVKSGFRSLGMQDMTSFLQALEDQGKEGAPLADIIDRMEEFNLLLPEVGQEIEDYKANAGS